jgi:Cd2+/Zn2+-exporting ATPase
MMVGDGVNDAPALREATSEWQLAQNWNEITLGGADAAVLGTDLRRLPPLIALADVTHRIMNQNVAYHSLN